MSQIHWIEYTQTCIILFIDWYKITDLSKLDLLKKLNTSLMSYVMKNLMKIIAHIHKGETFGCSTTPLPQIGILLLYVNI